MNTSEPPGARGILAVHGLSEPSEHDRQEPPLPASTSLFQTIYRASVSHPHRRLILLLMALKALLLYLLWYGFFSHPAAPHMRMRPAQVSTHLLSPSPIDTHPEEVSHASHR